uniref:Chlororespiratory reduction 4 n=1 Tax=Chenopodium quinoa TaxID=63459 RepID=A0A803N7Q5_CHEQI
MIRAYANSSTPQNALTIFSQMLASSTDPDKYTYPFVIKACSAFSGLNEGQQVHGLVEKCEEMRENLYVQNTLISMYAICGCFEDARKVLGKMPQRDVISWNALLSAFVEKGMMDSARLVFDEMEERNVESWNFMVSGFAKMGFIEEARRVFDEIPVKDVVSWNAVISGYADVGDFSEVLVLFQAMLREKINPDSYTLVNVLSACANLGALSQGEWVYLYIDKNGICIEDVSTWNSMVGGLSINGFGEEAVGIFRKMLEDECKPNEITFVNVLSACSHAGLLIEGLEIFNTMIHEFKIEPTIEHCGCVIDLLSRVGLLEEAKEILKGRTLGHDSPVLWQSLLSSCINYGNMELARDVAEKLLKLDPQDNSGYVQLSNIYASEGKWERVAEVRRNMKSKGVTKEAGCSMIEIDGVVHEFLAGEGFVS